MRFSWHQKFSDMVLQASQKLNPANIWSGWDNRRVVVFVAITGTI